MLLHNIPIVVYSAALLVVLHFWLSERAQRIEQDPQSSSSMSWTWSISIGVLKVLGWIPVASALGVALWEYHQKKKREESTPNPNPSPLLDADGTPVETYSRRKHLPFLPDREYCTEEDYYDRQLDIEITSQTRGTILQWMTLQAQSGTGISPLAVCDRASWALVTGASGGIGRAICISLARRKIPVVLVARDFQKLKAVAEEIQEVYGVMAVPIPCDVTDPTQIQGLLKALENCHPPTLQGVESTHGLLDKIDILVNNAGVGDLGDFFQPSTTTTEANTNGCVEDTKETKEEEETAATNDDHHISVESMIRLNVLGATQLTQAIGNHMLRLRQPNASTSISPEDPPKTAGARIVFVSSVMGMYPGVPGSAVYAATKAYHKSLCASLSAELEDASEGRIRMVCVFPGATRDTHFASTAHMTRSASFFVLPQFNNKWGCGLALSAEYVAEATVQATIRGTQREVVVGLLYRVSALLKELLPDRLALFLTGLGAGDVEYFQATPTSSKVWSLLSKFVFLPHGVNNNGGSDGDKDDTKNSSNSSTKKNN